MSQFKVVSNSATVIRSLDKLQRKTLPKVISDSLTSTTFDIRKHIVEKVYPRSFTIRNKVLPRAAFRVDKARPSKQVASVYDRFDKDFLRIQASGGTKRPRSSNQIAIPTTEIKRTRSGKINKTKRPRNLRNSFTRRIGKGKKGIFQRVGKKIRLMYVLQKTVKIDKAFPFFEESRRIAKRQMPKHFRTKLKRQLLKIRT